MMSTEELVKVRNEAAASLDGIVPPGCGFSVVIYDGSENGGLIYACRGDMKDVIVAMNAASGVMRSELKGMS